MSIVCTFFCSSLKAKSCVWSRNISSLLQLCKTFSGASRHLNLASAEPRAPTLICFRRRWAPCLLRSTLHCRCRTVCLILLFAPCRPGSTPFPLIHSLPHILLCLLLSPFFTGFIYFLTFSIPSLSTQIVSLHFKAGRCRRRPNLGLVFFVWILCYMYFLGKGGMLVFCCIWFSFVLWCDSCHPCCRH